MCAKSQNVIEYAHTRDESDGGWSVERDGIEHLTHRSMARAIIFILVDHLMDDIISKVD